MQQVPIVECDDKQSRAASGVSAQTLTKTASYTLTVQDILNAGGHPHINVSSAAAAVDITLPSAAAVPGCHITLFKPSGNTNKVGFLDANSQSIEGSTANKRFNNGTNELGACTIWSTGATWRVVSTKGTWAVDNT